MECRSYGVSFDIIALEWWSAACWSYGLARGRNLGNHRSEGLQIFLICQIKLSSTILCARALRVLTCASDLADMWSCRPTLDTDLLSRA